MGHVPSTGKGKVTFLFTSTHNGSVLPFYKIRATFPCTNKARATRPFYTQSHRTTFPFSKKRKALPLQSKKSTILGNKKGRPHSPLQKRKGHQPFYKVGKGTVLFCKKKRRKGHISVQKGWANPFLTDKDEHLPPLLITNRPPLCYGKGIRTPLHPFTREGRPLMPG